MPFLRRKTAPAPLPQQWVAYMYQPMPPMYAGPYVQQSPYPVPSNNKYANMALQCQTLPVHYYQTTYSDTPHHSANTLPIHQRVTTVESDYQPRKLYRTYSGGQHVAPIPTAPISRGGGYAFPHTPDEYDVKIETQRSAKYGILGSIVNFARNRSKSRHRSEAEAPARPRSRGSVVDDGQRGRAMDPRYVEAHRQRERRLSGDSLKKAKYESQRNFEKSMLDSLEKSLREGPLPQEDPYRVPVASMPPASMPRSPLPPNEDHLLLEHTKLNARRRSHRDSGYHTDAPTSKSSRRASMPLHARMAPPLEKSAPALQPPEGFFNQRGDQLMNSKGDILRRPPQLEYPPEFQDYPPPGRGWQDHKGQVS